MQAFATHDWPKLHEEHIAPPLPHSEDEEPERHMPVASQQPVAHVSAEHPAGIGVPQLNDTTANATTSRKIRMREPCFVARTDSSGAQGQRRLPGPPLKSVFPDDVWPPPPPPPLLLPALPPRCPPARAPRPCWRGERGWP